MNGLAAFLGVVLGLVLGCGFVVLLITSSGGFNG